MFNAADIKQDTLHLLLANALHRGSPIKDRALRISKACKLVRDRTKDDLMYNACRAVIKAVSKGDYCGACEAIEKTELNYWAAYK